MQRTKVRTTQLDYLDMHLENLTEEDTVYVDPPYKSADVRAYKANTLDHSQLVDILKNAKFRWILSEFYDPIYLNAFGEPVVKKELRLNTVNLKHQGSVTRTECLWKNF